MKQSQKRSLNWKLHLGNPLKIPKKDKAIENASEVLTDTWVTKIRSNIYLIKCLEIKKRGNREARTSKALLLFLHSLFRQH
jgi:hypothetical protein